MQQTEDNYSFFHSFENVIQMEHLDQFEIKAPISLKNHDLTHSFHVKTNKIKSSVLYNNVGWQTEQSYPYLGQLSKYRCHLTSTDARLLDAVTVKSNKKPVQFQGFPLWLNTFRTANIFTCILIFYPRIPTPLQ